MGIELIKLIEVKKISGLSKSEIWRRVSRKSFPIPVRLSVRCARWSRSEVEAWTCDRLAERQVA